MTRILLIAPRQEILIGGFTVHNNESVHSIEDQIRNKLPEYGEIERILIAGGTIRIMDPGDPIPIPLQAGKVIK